MEEDTERKSKQQIIDDFFNQKSSDEYSDEEIEENPDQEDFRAN